MILHRLEVSLELTRYLKDNNDIKAKSLIKGLDLNILKDILSKTRKLLAETAKSEDPIWNEPRALLAKKQMYVMDELRNRKELSS